MKERKRGKKEAGNSYLFFSGQIESNDSFKVHPQKMDFT